jgi:hypothetical protein
MSIQDVPSVATVKPLYKAILHGSAWLDVLTLLAERENLSFRYPEKVAHPLQLLEASPGNRSK